MSLIPVLRALFAWYAVLGMGAAVFVFTEWLGRSFMAPPVQSICGAIAGATAALGVLMRLHELRHPCDIWRPGTYYDFSKAAKVTGSLAGAAGAIDSVFRTSHWQYKWIPMAVAALLAVVAAAFARMAKSAAVEETPSWKHSA
jgi:hypothetical protein